MHPWAALYVFQVAIGMAVWPWLYRDAAILIGVGVGIPFAILGVLLLRSKAAFSVTEPATVSNQEEQEGKQDG